MPMRAASTNGCFATASNTAWRSTMTFPPQSPEISSTNFWPKPVDPRGFGATMTHPCAAHSDGFQREDQASSQAPCGPPWIRNTTGYFFAASKSGGVISQYWIGVPPAPATVRLRGSANEVWLTHESFSRVNGVGWPLPSVLARNRSAGLVSVDFEKTTKPWPGFGVETEPPCTTRFG